MLNALSKSSSIGPCITGAKHGFLLLVMAWCSLSFAEESFRIRAVHIDNRIQVLPPAELKRLANRMSMMNINTIIMEWEGSFPFDRNHVISNRFAHTKKEVAEFIAYCDGLGIEVIPLQQCIGHLEYVLKHERYAALREDVYDVSQVCPQQQELVLDLYEEMLEEMIELHPSKYFHVGGDETALLGHCKKCQAYVKEHGKSRLFIEHIKSVAELVTKHGKIPVLWADIVSKHPEAIEELPKECILVNWNYGWNIDRFGNHQRLLDSGLELWGALAMRSNPDNFFRSSWDKHFGNIEDFIPFARESGYDGVVLTSWSTSGQYTFVREPRKHILEMQAIRHVYPMVGFGMLLDAYGNAIKEEGFQSKKFAAQYCEQEFGMSSADTAVFLKGLFAPAEVLIDGASSLTTEELKAVQHSTKEFCDFLHDVQVDKNQNYFEHIKLMHDIRLFFVEVQVVRSEVEAMTGDPSEKEQLVTKLEGLQEAGQVLNDRFSDLHKENLFPGAIEIENSHRNHEVNLLYQKVLKQR